MKQQGLFRIGEVANIFHLSVGILRHYEALGLLTPEHIDPSSGYRYYGLGQFEALNTIRYLRTLDMPLDQIRDFFQNKDIDTIEEKLHRQKEAVARKQQKLAVIERKIDNRLRQLQDARSSQLDTIQQKQLPPCRLVWREQSLQIQDFFDMEPPIRKLAEGQSEPTIFLGKVGVGISPENLLAGTYEQYDSIFLMLDAEDIYLGTVTQFPETSCVSVRFRGSHKDAPAYYQMLMEYITQHQLQLSGFSREITMIDYGITNDTEKFVTEISIPVA